MEIKVVKDYSELSKVAAQQVVSVINEKPNALLGLATGSTPIQTYQELINLYNEKKVDFSEVVTLNLDEYVGLEGTHPQSYRHFMNENLFDHINIDKNNTHIPNGNTGNPGQAANDYEALCQSLGRIDLQILGIGTNGHIGFNEPDDPLSVVTHVVDLLPSTIEDNKRFFERVEDVPTKAVTMGVGQIMMAKKIILLVSGENKAEIFSTLLNDEVTTNVPASLLKLHPNVLVIVDEAAYQQ